jgi:hypothetical protein
VLVVFQFWKPIVQERTDGIPFNAVGPIKMFGDLGCNGPGSFEFCSNSIDE